MDQLEMLTAREQLMEDIDSIVESMLENVDIDDVDKETMITSLCDSVCRNFPTIGHPGRLPAHLTDWHNQP